MPDVFVAPDEKKDVVMHKRTPLPSSSFSPKSLPQLEESQPISSDPVSQTFSEETPSSPTSSSSPSHAAFLAKPSTEGTGGIPLFTSFWQNPRGVYFDTQEANEHILLFLRQHFITNIPWIFFTVLFLLLPPVAIIFLRSTNVFFINVLPLPFLSAVIVFYYIVVLTHAFTHFLSWYFNISLITPKRVLDIELKDLVYKKISATKISLVQDINYQQSGTIRTLFNYGDVLIQTAGAQDNFYVNATPKPETVVKIVEQLIGKTEEDENNNV